MLEEIHVVNWIFLHSLVVHHDPKHSKGNSSVYHVYHDKEIKQIVFKIQLRVHVLVCSGIMLFNLILNHRICDCYIIHLPVFFNLSLQHTLNYSRLPIMSQGLFSEHYWWFVFLQKHVVEYWKQYMKIWNVVGMLWC